MHPVHSMHSSPFSLLRENYPTIRSTQQQQESGTNYPTTYEPNTAKQILKKRLYAFAGINMSPSSYISTKLETGFTPDSGLIHQILMTTETNWGKVIQPSADVVLLQKTTSISSLSVHSFALNEKNCSKG